MRASETSRFCVSIGVQRDGRGEVGVVYDPLLDELFAATRGQGATRNGRHPMMGGIWRIRDGAGRREVVTDEEAARRYLGSPTDGCRSTTAAVGRIA